MATTNKAARLKVSSSRQTLCCCSVLVLPQDKTLSFVLDYRPTHRTVERDVKRIYSKTGDRNRKQLTVNRSVISDPNVFI